MFLQRYACLQYRRYKKYKALKVGLKLTKALLGGMREEFTDSTIENKILEKNTRFIIYQKKVRCF